jgi:hypothetical protein
MLDLGLALFFLSQEVKAGPGSMDPIKVLL